jgi:heme exporter protein A
VSTGRGAAAGFGGPLVPTLHVERLEKRFGARRVLGGLTFQVAPGEVLGVAGPNGSGKSTLLQILCGLTRPSAGSVVFRGDGDMDPRMVRLLIGFASPALALYDELSAGENLAFFARWRGLAVDAPALLQRVGLDPRRADPLRTYSSGMRQRVKLAWAVLHDPPILLLDEPGANLDAEGRAVVAQLIEERRGRGWTVIASNDPDELDIASRRVTLAAAGLGPVS